MALQDDLLRLVPVSILHSRLEVRSVVPVQIGKDAVLVPQTAIVFLGRSAILDGCKGAGRTGSGGRGREGAGGEVSERGSRGGHRSRYHLGRDAQWSEGEGWEGEKKSGARSVAVVEPARSWANSWLLNTWTWGAADWSEIGHVNTTH